MPIRGTSARRSPALSVTLRLAAGVQSFARRLSGRSLIERPGPGSCASPTGSLAGLRDASVCGGELVAVDTVCLSGIDRSWAHPQQGVVTGGLQREVIRANASAVQAGVSAWALAALDSLGVTAVVECEMRRNWAVRSFPRPPMSAHRPPRLRQPKLAVALTQAAGPQPAGLGLGYVSPEPHLRCVRILDRPSPLPPVVMLAAPAPADHRTVTFGHNARRPHDEDTSAFEGGASHSH